MMAPNPNAEHEAALQRWFPNRHPVGISQWRNLRPQLQNSRYIPQVVCCQWCHGQLDDFNHEASWDALRMVVYPTGAKLYLKIPAWFPTTVCGSCADYLTPFLQVLTDIGLLELYCYKLERLICDVRRNESRRAPIHWSAPVHFSGCRASGIGRDAGSGHGDCAGQAVEEHQRQSLFGDQNRDVPARCGHQTRAVRQTSDRRSERVVEPSVIGGAFV